MFEVKAGIAKIVKFWDDVPTPLLGLILKKNTVNFGMPDQRLSEECGLDGVRFCLDWFGLEEQKTFQTPKWMGRWLFRVFPKWNVTEMDEIILDSYSL